MKKCILLVFTLISVLSYGQNSSTTDEGVIINGVKWATRNVDEPGTFAPTPESAGKFYQWNRKRAWNTTDRTVPGWDRSIPSGTSWTRNNDPCPSGWRIPTDLELKKLIDSGRVWTTRNGVEGSLFGTAPNQIFLPIAGWRDINSSMLLEENSGNYWSSTVFDSTIKNPDPYTLFFNSISPHLGGGARQVGMSVRCVSDK